MRRLLRTDALPFSSKIAGHSANLLSRNEQTLSPERIAPHLGGRSKVAEPPTTMVTTTSPTHYTSSYMPQCTYLSITNTVQLLQEQCFDYAKNVIINKIYIINK